MSGTTTTAAPAADLTTLPVLPAASAGTAVLAVFVPGVNGAEGTPYQASYQSYQPASAATAGLVKPGAQIAVAADGTMSISGAIGVANGGTGATTAAAARNSLGLAAVAASGAYSDLTGTPTPYALPPATSSALGGVKPDGTTITVNAGVISAAPTVIPVTKIAASGASQGLAAPASGSQAYDITLTANCVLSLSGGAAGQQQTITAYLRQDATAGHLPTLPAGVRWPGGAAPTPNTAAGVIDVFYFTTPDAGTTWFGSY